MQENKPIPPSLSERWAVLLLAHGAPDKLEDIPEFLLNVRGGRPLPDPVVKEIAHRYSLIGGGSPLLRVTTLQAEAMRWLSRQQFRPVIGPVARSSSSWLRHRP